MPCVCPALQTYSSKLAKKYGLPVLASEDGHEAALVDSQGKAVPTSSVPLSIDGYTAKKASVTVVDLPAHR